MLGMRFSSKALGGLMREKSIPEAKGRHGIVAWFLGLLMCYQLGCHYFLNSTLRQLAAEDEMCESGDPAVVSSFQCTEARLFRSWQDATVAEDVLHLESFLREEEQAKLVAQPTAATTASTTALSVELSVPTVAPQPELPEGSVDVAKAAAAAEADSSATAAPAVAAKDSRIAWDRDLAALRRQLDEMEEFLAQPGREAMAGNATHATSADGGLLAEITEARCEMCLEPHRRSYPECAEFANISDCHHAAAPETRSWSNMTTWAQSLMSSLEEHLSARQSSARAKRLALQKKEAAAAGGSLLEQITEARCEMCLEPFRRDYPECAEFLNVSTCQLARSNTTRQSSSMTAWAMDLQRLQAQLEERLNASRVRAAARQHKAHGSKQRDGSLQQRIDELGCELCLAPHRRGRADCAHFLGSPTCRRAHADLGAWLDARLAELSEQHREWDQRVSRNAKALRRELCADPSRRGYAACADLLSEGGAANGVPTADDEPLATTSLRGQQPFTLRWPEFGTGAAWASSTFQHWKSATHGPVALRLRDLKRTAASHWQGRIPKVACIAVVPHSWEGIWMLQEVVDTFRKQDYEGPRELVLVYHYRHKEAAQHVEALADGSEVRGVAARGDGDYPSTAAYRFGAWKSDADIIARWDFSGWSSPQRLKMQVRAMVLASRPACIVNRHIGVLAANASSDADERTTMGEATWMRHHWFPLQHSVRPMLEGYVAPQVVRLDMPWLHLGDLPALA